jgi:hypothetical protein
MGSEYLDEAKKDVEVALAAHPNNVKVNFRSVE